MWLHVYSFDQYDIVKLYNNKTTYIMVNICGKLYVYSGVSLKVSPWLCFRGLVESQSLTWRYSQCCVVNIFLTIRINMYTSRWERVVGDILLDCREMFDTGTSSLGNILQDYNLSNYNTTCRALQPFSAFGLNVWFVHALYCTD